MTLLYIYLSGTLIIWCVFAYFAFIEKEQVRKKDILVFGMFSIMSYVSIILFIIILVSEYIEEHGDEVVFNKKEEDDD